MTRLSKLFSWYTDNPLDEDEEVPTKDIWQGNDIVAAKIPSDDAEAIALRHNRIVKQLCALPKPSSYRRSLDNRE